MEMLASGSCDAERLLDEPVRLVPIPIRFLLVLVVRDIPAVICGSSVGPPRAAIVTSASLSFHLSVCEEASRYTAGAPRLSVRPSSHARLSLVPNVDGSGSDSLTFFFGESSLYTREQPSSASFEKFDGICWRANEAIIGLHLVGLE